MRRSIVVLLSAALVLLGVTLVLAAAGCGGDQAATGGKTAGPAPEMIAFEDGKGIAAVRPDGSGLLRITDAESPESSSGFGESYRDFAPAWSPAGDRIAFLSGRDGNLEIYVADADGANERNLTDNPGADGRFGFAWSPDGSRIAFVSDREGSSDLWLVNVDGSGLTNLTTRHDVDPAGWEIPATAELSWSPEGTRIAFAAHNQGIQVISADGSELVRLSQLHAASLEDQEGNVTGTIDVSLDFGPMWSPDGERIAYLVGAGELHVMRADGTADAWITGGTKGTEVSYFAWSPEGKRIAFNPLGGHVYVVNSDGSCQTQLTAESDEYWAQGPSWSPDGTRIAFASNRPGRVDAYVMNDDGSAQTRLTESSAGSDVNSVTWSPGVARADREMACPGGESPGSATPPVAATSMIVTGKAGYLEGVAARTGEFQEAIVGAFSGGWRQGFCVEVPAASDGSFRLEIPSGCFQEGETVWLTAGGLNACPTPPFEAGSQLEVLLKGSTAVIGCENGQTPILGVPGVGPPNAPSLLTPIGNVAIVQNDPESGCTFDPARGYGYKIVFDWSDSTAAAGIRRYNFALVAYPNQSPVYQTFVEGSTLAYVKCNEYVPDGQLEGWGWYVEAEDRDGNFSEWSPRGDFRFEPCRIDGVPCYEP